MLCILLQRKPLKTFGYYLGIKPNNRTFFISFLEVVVF